MSEPFSPAMLNIKAATYVDRYGLVHPVTNWFDNNGEECAPEDAVTFVAGSGGTWFAHRIDEFHSEQFQ